jgi:hypothetical protein
MSLILDVHLLPIQIQYLFLFVYTLFSDAVMLRLYRGADKSLARPGTKQATATKPAEMNKTPRW